MGGTTYFHASPFFAENIYYTYFQIQPGSAHICPTGDIARDSAMPLTPYEREIVQISTFWMGEQDEEARAFGRWFLAHIVPDYTGPSFNHRGAYFQDVLYGVQGPQRGPEQLGLMHYAPGNGWVSVRSGSEPDATSLTVLGARTIDQSHSHYDVGSFLLWKHDWQAVDPVTYSEEGLCWDSGAHNMIHVAGHERRGGDSPGLAKLEHSDAFVYFQIDATQMYRVMQGTELHTMMEEVTRELVFLPPDALVVYDRVEPKPGASDYDFRVHFATRPVESGGQFSAVHGGGGISLQMLQGGATSILADADLVDSASDAWRVQVEPTGASSRFLALLQVASGAAPTIRGSALATQGDVQGALWEDQAVVFSSLRRGAPAALPFFYTANSESVRAHILVNIAQPCDVSVTKRGGSTIVTVSPGSTYSPSDNGVVRVEF
jgi:hypothetical protein